MAKKQWWVPWTWQKETQKESAKLFVSLLFGVVIVAAFGFRQEEMKETIIVVCPFLWLNPPHEELKSWECWEIGSLLWSAVTSAIYYFSTSPIRIVLLDRLVVGMLTLVMVVLHLLAAHYIFEHRMDLHVWAVVGIGFVFTLIDGLIFYFQSGQGARGARERREALEAFLFADVPMIVAFLIFLRFNAGEHTHREPQIDIFLSGAISFQFVASTFVFAFIQGGLYHHLAEWMEHQRKDREREEARAGR
jgi:hypothetical protein